MATVIETKKSKQIFLKYFWINNVSKKNIKDKIEKIIQNTEKYKDSNVKKISKNDRIIYQIDN